MKLVRDAHVQLLITAMRHVTLTLIATSRVCVMKVIMVGTVKGAVKDILETHW